MTRREIREEIFRLLFRIEFYSEEELEEQLQFTADEGEASEADAAYIQNKIRDLAGRVTEIDDMINAVARGWKTGRMGKVDLTLIRLAVYEIKFEEDIPTGVAINEAVELAKRYGTDGSSSFVNGILAKIV
ncbi:MAG: transcription antitermination factor NusB [Lachnospiraceae bacterium]|nr:transcription antitermination factor NusB [Lachnospiraceae bacterium]